MRAFKLNVHVTHMCGAAAEQWAITADPSLVRHFIFCVLAAVSPPFSSQFASPLIRSVLTNLNLF